MLNTVKNYMASKAKYQINYEVKPTCVNSRENIKEILEKSSIGESVICSKTPDFAISSLLYGAESVIFCSSNIIDFLILDLKITALKVLDYEEFIRFFSYRRINHEINFNVFDQNIYNKIRKHLSNNSIFILDCLYQQGSGYMIRISNMFEKSELDIIGLLNANPLFNKQDFYQLKKILNKKSIPFVLSSIDDILKRYSFVDNIIMPCSNESDIDYEYQEYLAQIKTNCNELIADYVRNAHGKLEPNYIPISYPNGSVDGKKDAVLILR